MEKAILKTLIYADIFEYPLKTWEIHKWLIGKRAQLIDVEKGVGRLLKKRKINAKKDFVYLKRREKLVNKRLRNKKQADLYFIKALRISYLLRIIPTIKLIGISGGLALENASKKDDIDLFIIVRANTVWLSRFLILGVLSITGQRRKRQFSKRQAAGKICVNILVDENNLEQEFKDVYTAHELLQMKPLYQKEDIYSRYLEANLWVFDFLPNWTSSVKGRVVGRKERAVKEESFLNQSLALKLLEDLAKKVQLRIMGEPQGLERIQEGAVYLLPEDYRNWVLKAYAKKLKKVSLASSSASFSSLRRLPSSGSFPS